MENRPPIWVTGRGFVGIILGGQGVIPSSLGNSSRIPLWCATSSVNKRVVNTLVRRGISILRNRMTGMKHHYKGVVEVLL